MLLPEYDQEMANTRKLLERVPDDKFDYQPHPKSMALGRLATHIAELPSWAKQALENEVLDMQPGYKPHIASSREELLRIFDKSTADARAAIAVAADEAWQKTWTFKFAGKQIMSLPRAAVVRTLMLNHLIHHRAQLGVFLRLNNVEIPGMYGPSADEMKFWEGANSAAS